MPTRKVILLSDENMAPVERRFPSSFNRQSTRILYAIRAIAQQINDEANGWLASFGVNASTYNYLVSLYAADRFTLTQNEIRSFTHTSEATVTQIVRALERDGLVRRAKNPDDARSVLVTLTKKGIRTMEGAVPFHHGMLERHMADLSAADRERLLSLLLVLSESFSAGKERVTSSSGRPLATAKAAKASLRR
jgi:DNA-binding MarR family transcriptional regulator